MGTVRLVIAFVFAFAFLVGQGCSDRESKRPEETPAGKAKTQPVKSTTTRPRAAKDTWALLFHLVPEYPEEVGATVYTGSSPIVIDGKPAGYRVQCRLHLLPQRKLSGKQVIERFGRPDEVRKGEKRKFAMGPGRDSEGVAGDLWLYGRLAIMVQEGQVRYIWIQAENWMHGSGSSALENVRTNLKQLYDNRGQ